MFTLFFVEDLPTTVGAHYEFSNEDANHAIRVLRMQPGADSCSVMATVRGHK
jgi:16S rRNA (uracil1498-N3)-methyltransferase